MRAGLRAAMTVTTVVMALGSLVPATQAQERQDWSYAGVERIEIDGTSGELRVERAPGTEVEVSLRHDVEPADAFRPVVDRQGGTLRLEEDWRGSGNGSVEWTVRIPSSLQPVIDFDTASGSLEAEGVEASFRFDSASGGVRFRQVTVMSGSTFDTASGDYAFDDTVVGDDVGLDTASGDVELTGVRAGRGFEFDTASGDILVEGSRGILEGSTASGDVRVRDSVLTGASRFSSASGSVIATLPALPDHDMELSSASGDVRLETAFGGDFALVMSAREDRGEIDSPFEYTSEETYEGGDHTYMRKIVRSGSGSPEIRLRTASGRVEVRER